MMKNNTDRFFEKAIQALENSVEPAADQRKKILQTVLDQGRMENAASRFKNFIAVYPWRFAFGVAVVQSIVCTLIFGSNYTNLIMRLLGR